ncbi:MAG TPA: J domain-containing protein [Candidatus Limnocylindrales bacterium]|nr:J domain-containing protein [Candidatus Limnocylindrales bacterium]
MSERENLYRVLQVDPAANQLVIQAAYRVLARIFHPDVEGDDDQMKRLNHAWSVLGDPLRRAEYDRQLAGRHHGPAASHTTTTPARSASTGAHGSASSAPSGRTSTTPRSAPARPDDHAGPPQGEPFGPLLNFGRYGGWTLGQVARVDRAFLEWLRNVPAGRGLKDEIDAVLQVRRGPGAVDERRHYETNKAKVHAWMPGAPTRVR